MLKFSDRLKRIFWAGIALGVAAGLPAHALAATAEEPKPVLELFTSQGCSSCPPADALLGKYAARKDVIALSLPVDYWDYLGWKDTLASPLYSNRQRAYARARGDGQVYTPQIVVSGARHVVGSHETAVERAVAAAKKALKGRHVPMAMWAEGDTLMIETGAAPDGLKKRAGTIWLALVKKSEKVAIKRGENHGRKITYYNVVRELTPVGKWSGKAMTLKLPKHALMQAGSDGCTVLLQQGDSGPIIGAAEMRTW